MGIEPSATVLLLVRSGRVDRAMLAPLTAAAAVGGDVVVLVVASDGHAMMEAAARCGAAARVRVVSPTRDLAPLLATADVGLALGSAAARSGAAWQSGSACRVVADCMLAGLPVVVDSTHPAAMALPGLLADAHSASPGTRWPGLIVDAARSDAWFRALKIAADPSWRLNAGIAARGLAMVHGVDLESFVDRIERQLGAAAWSAVGWSGGGLMGAGAGGATSGATGGAAGGSTGKSEVVPAATSPAGA